MDYSEDYTNKSKKVISIINKSSSAKDFINRINRSDKIDLNEDFDIIILQLQTSDFEILLFEFMEELQNTGKVDLLIDNISNIDLDKALEFSIKHNNDEISEYIYSNFNELAENSNFTNINLIKEVLLKSIDRPEIKKGIHSIIKNLSPEERETLLDEIDSNSLINIEEYLEDLLYVEEEYVYEVNLLLFKLSNINYLDKSKLLQVINGNLINLINSFDRNSDYELEIFFAIIKEIENKLPKNSDKSQSLIDETKKIISNELENILQRYECHSDLINKLREIGIDNKKFLDLQDNIIEKLSQGDLVMYIESAKGNEGFNKNWDAEELTKQLFKHNVHILDDEILQSMISKLIKELCEHENKGIEDIEYGGSGASNFNIKIGEYILKLGETRKSGNIPNDKRILKPLVRQQTNVEKDENLPDLFVEIQNVVDTKWTKGLTEEEINEELYKVYSELKSRGKIWTDIKADNIGRLLKPNKENFNIKVLNENGEVESKELKTDNYAIGFNGQEPEEILQPGELVIIDTEYLFEEGEKYETLICSKFIKFEERYNKEKQQLDSEISTKDIKEIIRSEEYTLENACKTKAKIETEIGEKNTKEYRGKQI